MEFDPDSPERRADVTPAQLPHTQHPDGRRAYRFKLRNMGPSYAKHVSVWLVDDQSSPISSRSIGMPLDVREEVEVALNVPEEVWSAEPQAKLMIEWFNDRQLKESEPSNMLIRWDY